MTWFSHEATVTARKPHWCEYCCCQIPVGTLHVKMAGKWGGDFCAGRGHSDCKELWDKMFDEYGDPNDGMPWNLPEHISDMVSPFEAQASLDHWRGFYPHAVNRIEFRLRNWMEDE